MSNDGWMKFVGGYEKRFYDVRFANGVIYYGIWPNAGQFFIPAEQRVFKHDRVLTERDNFEIRPSVVDDRGMPVREATT